MYDIVTKLQRANELDSDVGNVPMLANAEKGRKQRSDENAQSNFPHCTLPIKGHIIHTNVVIMTCSDGDCNNVVK